MCMWNPILARARTEILHVYKFAIACYHLGERNGTVQYYMCMWNPIIVELQYSMCMWSCSTVCVCGIQILILARARTEILHVYKFAIAIILENEMAL